MRKHPPVLLPTIKLAQNTSQYYFVPQSLQNLLPSTTLSCKTSTKYFPGQYYFAVQDLHKILPSTPCLPVVFAQAFCRKKLLNTETVAHRSFYAEKLLHTEAFKTQKLSDREAFRQRNFYTQTLLHTKAHKSFCTQKLLHRQVLHSETFTHRSFLQTEAFTLTGNLAHREAFIHRNLQLQNRILAPKQTNMKRFSDFSQGIFKAKMEMSLLTNHRRNLDTASPIRFTTLSCKRPKYYTHSRCKP